MLGILPGLRIKKIHSHSNVAQGVSLRNNTFQFSAYIIPRGILPLGIVRLSALPRFFRRVWQGRDQLFQLHHLKRQQQIQPCLRILQGKARQALDLFQPVQ